MRCPVITLLESGRFVPAVRVARKTNNSSLELVAVADLSCKVLAYLALTDNKGGALLLRTDENGLVSLRLDSPRSSFFHHGGAGEPKTTRDRKIIYRMAVDRQSMLSASFGYAA